VSSTNWSISVGLEVKPTRSTTLSNAFDKDYSAAQAVEDLEKLMNEAQVRVLAGPPSSIKFI